MIVSHRKLAALGRHRGGFAFLGAVASWGALHGAIRAAGSVDALLAWMPFRCPLRMFTGIECPTCGLGHAFVEAVAGNFGASWHHHPGGVLSMFAAITGLLVIVIIPRVYVAALARLRACTARHAVVAVALLLYTLWGFARTV